MIIRQAATTDIPELARLRWEWRATDANGPSRAAFLRDCESWLSGALSEGRWTAIVAESSPTRLAGCMFLQSVAKVPTPDEPNRAWGYVTSCYVVPEERNRGIGAKLLDALIATARDHDLEFLIVWPSEDSVSLYERAGFRSIGERAEVTRDEPPLQLALT